jgi:hypothetical protein
MTAVVVVLAVVTALNSLAVIGLVRQVGVLHLRLRPMPAHGVQYGPPPGSHLAVPVPSGARLVAFCFVSGGCGTCSALLPALRSTAASLATGEALLLVVDADDDLAVPAALPVVSVPNALRGSRIPATPFVVVTDGSATVLTAGGVGSLEQVEFLLDQGREVMAARSATGPPEPSRPLLPLIDKS